MIRRAALLLLAYLAVVAPGFAAETPDAKILFINSYHRGYSWSDGIEQGFRDQLEASGKKIEVSFEYLDSRRFSYGAQIELMAQAMAIKYASYRPNLVAVSDNAAFDFAIKYRERLFPGLPIIFCGYNNFRPEVLQGIANVTGINEEIDIPAVIEMALKVHPGTRNLAFIISTGEASSKRIGEVAEQTVFPKYRERFNVVVLKDASVAEIRQRLATLPRETVLFLSGQARDQGAGRALTPTENGRLIAAASPFPAYTFWDFHLDTGVIGGHILTGPDQGRAQADLALRVLAGTPADQIPVVMTSPASNIFDFKIMERSGITPSALPLHSVIINRPFSLWETYRWQIVAVVTLLASETLMIFVLVRSMRGRRKALEELAKERALLEQRVEARTGELQTANEQLAFLSRNDALTQLANRRHFDEVLEGEFLRLRRSPAPLSLILLDVDHFKNFNDTYGHVAGDECLRRVGALISSMVNRSIDLAARYGGEEFAVVLPETNAQGAATLAKRIREGIASLAIPHAASSVADRVTASLGIVTVATTVLTSSLDVVKLADEQLYRAKSNGRNRIEARELA